MKTHKDVEILPISPSLDTINCLELISTTDNYHHSRSNSSNNDQENNLDDDNIIISPIVDNSCEKEEDYENDSDYFAQFSCPEESDDDLEYFSNETNNDLLINNHLNRKQLYLVEEYEEKNYQRTKRSNKKMNARCQIKTKYAKTIKIKSHNKQLYMHHRLVKKVTLDPPSHNYLSSYSSIPTYSSEALRSIVDEYRQRKATSNSNKQTQRPIINQNNTSNAAIVPPQLRPYTINEHNIPNEPTFDDAMITFLLDMQNRDLSPEDYEMLLRLDERVQRKTVDTNILDTLPTVNVNETHINDQCTICMELYILGQQLKLLPCTHMFHLNCIETYLKEFSVQCPLDNLPII